MQSNSTSNIDNYEYFQLNKKELTTVFFTALLSSQNKEKLNKAAIRPIFMLYRYYRERCRYEITLA